MNALAVSTSLAHFQIAQALASTPLRRAPLSPGPFGLQRDLQILGRRPAPGCAAVM